MILIYSPRLFSQIPLFTPPANWQCAQSKTVSDYVQIGFIGTGSSQFRPSVSLATEEIDASLKEYIKAVKELYLADPGTSWRDLGKFSMKAGVGRLIEISSTSPFGPVKTLQAVLVDKKTAYILTATILKKDFIPLQKEILRSLQSLSLQPDLFAALPDPEKRKKLQILLSSLGTHPSEEDISIQQKNQWELLQKEILHGYPEMGSHWHFLVLKEGHTKIYQEIP